MSPLHQPLDDYVRLSHVSESKTNLRARTAEGPAISSGNWRLVVDKPAQVGHGCVVAMGVARRRRTGDCCSTWNADLEATLTSLKNRTPTVARNRQQFRVAGAGSKTTGAHPP